MFTCWEFIWMRINIWTEHEPAVRLEETKVAHQASVKQEVPHQLHTSADRNSSKIARPSGSCASCSGYSSVPPRPAAYRHQYQNRQLVQNVASLVLHSSGTSCSTTGKFHIGHVEKLEVYAISSHAWRRSQLCYANRGMINWFVHQNTFPYFQNWFDQSRIFYWNYEIIEIITLIEEVTWKKRLVPSDITQRVK